MNDDAQNSFQQLLAFFFVCGRVESRPCLIDEWLVSGFGFHSRIDFPFVIVMLVVWYSSHRGEPGTHDTFSCPALNNLIRDGGKR